MLYRTIEYAEHGYLSGLTKAAKKNKFRRGVTMADVHKMNGLYLANRSCVYPYGGYEVQRVPLGGGFCLIAPLYDESGIHRIGGNVVYQRYLDVDCATVERVYYSDGFKEWAGEDKVKELESINVKLNRFIVAWKNPWEPKLTVSELLEKISVSKFVERAHWNESFELSIVE